MMVSSSYHNRVLLTSGSAVMGVQGEQEVAEHTDLEGFGVEHQHGGSEIASLRSLCDLMSKTQGVFQSLLLRKGSRPSNQ